MTTINQGGGSNKTQAQQMTACPYCEEYRTSDEIVLTKFVSDLTSNESRSMELCDSCRGMIWRFGQLSPRVHS